MPLRTNLNRRTLVAGGLATPAVLLLAGAEGVPVSVAAPMRWADFHASLGVNTHLRYTNSQYNDLDSVISAIKYCGFQHVRDTAISVEAPNSGHYHALAEAGIRFCLFWGTGRTMADAISQIGALEGAHNGAVEYLEGPNEIQPQFTYAGRRGLEAGRQFMADMRAEAAQVSRLRDAAFVSFTGFSPASSGADIANHHPYPKAGDQPGELIRLRRDEWVGPSGAMPGKPMVFTEFGYHTLTGKPARSGHWQGVDEETQAVLLINGWLDAAAAGVTRTYLYQLFDGAPDRPGAPSQENHFGLFRLDGAPKRAARAVKLLLSLASDSSAEARSFAFRPARARVGADLPISVLPLQTASGRDLFVLWNEAPVWDKEAFARRKTAPFAVCVESLHPAVVSAWDILDSTPLTGRRDNQRTWFSMGFRPIVVCFA